MDSLKKIKDKCNLFKTNTPLLPFAQVKMNSFPDDKKKEIEQIIRNNARAERREEIKKLKKIYLLPCKFHKRHFNNGMYHQAGHLGSRFAAYKQTNYLLRECLLCVQHSLFSAYIFGIYADLRPYHHEQN